ncbi:phage major capsid protein [Faecalimonas umbilicata]|jgi:HK97 family phage major capsid protein|uniref:phage major capsid protein n=1 Tax=Faecalimonas umbilicata TaxID=1912855 RepID=UPI002A8133E9|nr:phage major capsid protein [Faecalimonas umbilicata]MDY4596858.1 phage major capsid protein [Faecalimonas umbilicata]
MSERLLNLLDMINAKKAEVKNLVEAGNLDEAEAAKNELKNMQREFDLLKDIEDAEFENTQQRVNTGEVTPITNTEDSVAEFANAARHGFRVSNSLSSGMRESSDPDGGYIVPEDIQTRINNWKEAEFSLESLISVENVKRNKGQRTYEKRATMTGFEDIEEGGELQEMDTPQFERIKYDIQDRGGWLPLTNDLLSDTDQNITEIITKWIARKSNATSNQKVIGLINTKEVSQIETMDEIKKAIIVTLGAAYRAGSKILTNDDGLFFFSTLKDNNGRDLLQPNPMNAMQMYLSVGPIKVPIIAVPNKVIASDVKEKGKLKIPMVCGDFKEAFKKYDRQRTSIMSSNVAVAGSLNAFTQNMTLVRAIERNDYKVLDNMAYTNMQMVVNDESVMGE